MVTDDAVALSLVAELLTVAALLVAPAACGPCIWAGSRRELSVGCMFSSARVECKRAADDEEGERTVLAKIEKGWKGSVG